MKVMISDIMRGGLQSATDQDLSVEDAGADAHAEGVPGEVVPTVVDTLMRYELACLNNTYISS